MAESFFHAGISSGNPYLLPLCALDRHLDFALYTSIYHLSLFAADSSRRKKTIFG
jgi:hypothetical protein